MVKIPPAVLGAKSVTYRGSGGDVAVDDDGTLLHDPSGIAISLAVAR